MREAGFSALLPRAQISPGREGRMSKSKKAGSTIRGPIFEHGIVMGITTQIPDQVYEALPFMDPPEALVTFVACRQFQSEPGEPISEREFCARTGIKSINTIKAGLSDSITRQIIEAVPVLGYQQHLQNCYRLRVSRPPSTEFVAGEMVLVDNSMVSNFDTMNTPMVSNFDTMDEMGMVSNFDTMPSKIDTMKPFDAQNSGGLKRNLKESVNINESLDREQQQTRLAPAQKIQRSAQNTALQVLIDEKVNPRIALEAVKRIPIGDIDRYVAAYREARQLGVANGNGYLASALKNRWSISGLEKTNIQARKQKTDPKLPQDILDMLSAIGWTAKLDPIVAAWKKRGGKQRVRTVLEEAQAWPKDHAAGRVSTALASGLTPGKKLDERKAQRRKYITGPYAESILH
jgi:hypothetical protein